jgi:hypothetical protein
MSRHALARGGFLFHAALRFFEIALVLLRLDQIARFIVNANHSAMRAAAMLRVVDCASDCVWLAVPQPTEWQRIGADVSSLFRARERCSEAQPDELRHLIAVIRA